MFWLVLPALAAEPPVAAVESDAGAAAQAREILGQAGVKGGFVVHVGARDGKLTAALRVNDSYLVHGLEADSARVRAAREAILRAGGYGPVCIDTWNGKDLPYVEGTVNLLVVEEPAKVSAEEIERVLAPLGVALVGRPGQWQATRKPWPKAIDEWTHYYYDAKGNAASQDESVGPPERLQWLGSPRWSRHHDRMSSLSAMVSSRGRLFYIMDEGSRTSILLPSKFQLIARDAFNGCILWKKPIAKWSTNLWPLKTGPTSLTRRLVADGERIFVTLGISEPISVLDGASGAVLKSFAATKGAEEMLYANGILYALVNPNADWVLQDFAPKFQSDQGRVAQEYEWDKKPRILVALNPDTGKILWQIEGLIAPLTPATDGKRLAYYDGDKIHCLDALTGKPDWVSAGEPRRKLYEFNFGPRLLFHDSLVLYAGGDGTMRGFDAASGKPLWEAPHEKSGYRSPEDLIVSAGLVWNAGTTSGSQSGEFIGRDPLSGQVKQRFAPDVPPDTYWFHHRCYIAKATEKFLIPSRTGIEYVDTQNEHWNLNHWVRGACLYGVLPCNGLTYAGPHDCACYPEAKLFGMNALAAKPKHPLPAPIPASERLEKGAAYDAVQPASVEPTDWPTYRHDAQRSSFTNQPLVPDLSHAWDAKLGGRLSALTVAGGKVFVSQVEAHTVYAFDAASGKPAWHFTAGSRVDSPPTWFEGCAIFGCMDGNVYCLRASDGELVWRFRAAPTDMRHMAFEQLESVWPVHGSVLVENGIVSFVCGRSCFLDGGMTFFRLDAKTGKQLVAVAYDGKDPASGKSLAALHKELQMPTALNDILSSDGKGTIYLRSQKIDEQGKRFEIAPVSGNAVVQGAAQKGTHPHIFAAFGYLDAEWFHRALWIYGEHSAGGYSGYFQPGKYAPTGRIMVFDDENVYSYGREDKYFKWTTSMEHTLHASSKTPPDVEPTRGGGGKAKPAAKAGLTNGVTFPEADCLNPAGEALTLECWVLPDSGSGVIINHGGGMTGYALVLQEKKPAFLVRAVGSKQLVTISAKEPLGEGWHHLAAVLGKDKSMTLYVDAQAVATGQSAGFPGRAKAPLSLGGGGAFVGGESPGPYTGMLDQLVIYHRGLAAAEVLARVARPEGKPVGEPALVCTFDNGDARDESGHGCHGVSSGVDSGKGKVGGALWFRVAAAKGKGASPATPAGGPVPATPEKGSFVQKKWDAYVPIVTRAMALAGKSLFISGPPHTVNEEYAFERLAAKDPAIQKQLEEEDASLEGHRGAKLWIMNVETGSQDGSLDLDSPPVWDGMVVARGKLYVATMDGQVKCFGK